MSVDTANPENASRERIEQTILSAAEQVFSQHGYRGGESSSDCRSCRAAQS